MAVTTEGTLLGIIIGVIISLTLFYPLYKVTQNKPSQFKWTYYKKFYKAREYLRKIYDDIQSRKLEK